MGHEALAFGLNKPAPPRLLKRLKIVSLIELGLKASRCWRLSTSQKEKGLASIPILFNIRYLILIPKDF